MDAQSLLGCWEHGRTRHALDRALLLHAAAAPREDPDTLADRPLGERNAALLRLRQSLFGDALNSCIDCPECAERLEFSLSAQTLLGRAGAIRQDAHVIVAGERLRLPTTRDLASIANEPDETHATRKLLERLRVDGIHSDLEVAHDELARAFDEADPCMDLAIELDCPACAHQWSAGFDVPGFLWEEIDVRARRLLDEVHVLARTYGWDETQILRLSEARRHAYLQRALA
jgi:hypothetical protein